MRAQKEKFAVNVSEIHKMINKRSFLGINSENGDDAMGFDSGIIGGVGGGSGKLRAMEANKKNALSKSKAGKKQRGVNGQIGVNGASTGVGGGGFRWCYEWIG